MIFRKKKLLMKQLFLLKPKTLTSTGGYGGVNRDCLRANDAEGPAIKKRSAIK